MDDRLKHYNHINANFPDFDNSKMEMSENILFLGNTNEILSAKGHDIYAVYPQMVLRKIRVLRRKNDKTNMAKY